MNFTSKSPKSKYLKLKRFSLRNPTEVDPYQIKINHNCLKYLDNEDRKSLENFLDVINRGSVGVGELSFEDQEKFHYLMYRMNLIEAGLIWK